MFNITISVIFFLKCFLGAFYREYRSFTMLREYMINRLLIDALLVMPALIYFRLRTATSSNSEVIVLSITIVSEFFILVRYSRGLFTVSTVETIEMIQPKDLVNVNRFP